MVALLSDSPLDLSVPPVTMCAGIGSSYAGNGGINVLLSSCLVATLQRASIWQVHAFHYSTKSLPSACYAVPPHSCARGRSSYLWFQRSSVNLHGLTWGYTYLSHASWNPAERTQASPVSSTESIAARTVNKAMWACLAVSTTCPYALAATTCRS